jgi:CRISPR-associated protein Csd1
MGQFSAGEFSSDKPLSGEFLLAYHSQRLELRNRKQPNEQNKSLIKGDAQ